MHRLTGSYHQTASTPPRKCHANADFGANSFPCCARIFAASAGFPAVQVARLMRSFYNPRQSAPGTERPRSRVLRLVCSRSRESGTPFQSDRRRAALTVWCLRKNALGRPAGGVIPSTKERIGWSGCDVSAKTNLPRKPGLKTPAGRRDLRLSNAKCPPRHAVGDH